MCLSSDFIQVLGNPNGCPTQTIFKYVDPSSLMRLRKTCKTLKTSVDDYVSREVLTDLATMVLTLSEDKIFLLERMPESLKTNRHFMTCAVQGNGIAYIYADKTLKLDLLIAKTALLSAHWFCPEQIAPIVKILPEEIRKRKDMEFLIETTIHPSLRYLSRHNEDKRRFHYGDPKELFRHATWTDDRDTVLLAVQLNGKALCLASKKLQADKEVVLTAVRNDGEALPFASVQLRTDEEVVHAVVQKKVDETTDTSEMGHDSKILRTINL